jgi:hypothetical protein
VSNQYSHHLSGVDMAAPNRLEVLYTVDKLVLANNRPVADADDRRALAQGIVG